MPFYRSTLQTSGGGGGGSESPYINVSSSSASLPAIDGLQFNSGYFMNHPEDVENITGIKIGNRVTNISGLLSWQPNFNAPVDLSEAILINDMTSCLQGLTNYNSSLIFPNYLTFETALYESYCYFNCGFVLSDDSIFNQPLTIKIHDRCPDDEHYTSVTLERFLNNCSNFNSKVVFDFNRTNKGIDPALATIQYTVEGMFYNCQNFNQPLIFPSGLTGLDYLFGNCISFNQPVIFDLYGSESGYYCNFSNMFKLLNNMSSDIIFYNSVYLNSDGRDVFNSFINNQRQSEINIYIQNSSGILDNNIAGVGQITWATSPSPTNASCNVYTNATLGITISEDIDYGLSQFNDYYYDFYGEYPVIPVV